MPDDPTASAPAAHLSELDGPHLLPRLRGWARANLRAAGIEDPDTAEEVVCRALAKVKDRYDPSRGPLGPFLWKVVWSEVQEERRRRRRRPGDYAAGACADDCLQRLADSFHQSLSELDTAWRRQQQGRTREALRRIRERIKPVEWEVFVRLKVQDHTAAEVARQINEEFHPAEALHAAKAHRIAYKVQKIFTQEFLQVGINPFEDGPDLSALREELGVARPPRG